MFASSVCKKDSLPPTSQTLTSLTPNKLSIESLMNVSHSKRQALLEMRGRVGANHTSSNLCFNVGVKVTRMIRSSEILPVSSSVSLQTLLVNSPREQHAYKNRKTKYEGVGLDGFHRATLETIKCQLTKSIHFNVINMSKLKQEAIDHKQFTLDPQRLTQLERTVETMSPDDTFAACCLSRQQSLEFQTLLTVCNDQLLVMVAKNMLANLGRYLVHPYGSYAIQKVLQRDSGFCKSVAEYCQSDFSNLARDEFASRIMQRLVEKMPSFKKYVLDHFSRRMADYLDVISAVFLVALAIRSSTDYSECTFIVGALSSKPDLIENKNFRRIIACYLEQCQPEQLMKVERILNIQGRIVQFLNDKYNVIILLVLVQRNYRPVVDALLTCLREQLSLVYQTKYYKFLFAKLIERGHISILSELHFSLLQASRLQLRALAYLPVDAQEYYRYTVLASCIQEHNEDIDSIFAMLAEERTKIFQHQRPKRIRPNRPH